MLLIRGLSFIVTFDDEDRELTDADILIDGPRIAKVGQGLSGDGIETIIDGRGLIALPGLVNAHQHLNEAALRAIPQLERVTMGQWIAGISERRARWWREGRFGPDTVGTVARSVLLESLLGGVTTVADQHLFFPGGRRDRYVEATIEAAMEIGVRLHAVRSSRTFGKSAGGFADDLLVEEIDSVIRHSQELVDQYHDSRPFGQIRIALGPSTIQDNQPEMFEAFASMAEDLDLRLHTHLYQGPEAAQVDQLYHMTPWQFLEQHGWANPRVWVAHAVDTPAGEIPDFAAAGVSVAHMAVPDLRMGWGLAPVRSFLDAGVTVGFGTSGSASNDGANVLGDLRLAALVHRSADPEDPSRWLSARELFRMATRGSAECLGRTDLGVIEPGRAADIACWDLTGVDRVGVHDPLIGLLMTGLSDRASVVVVNGEVLVEGERPTRTDMEAVARTTRSMIPREG